MCLVANWGVKNSEVLKNPAMNFELPKTHVLSFIEVFSDVTKDLKIQLVENHFKTFNLIRDFIYWMVTIFKFDHMTGENQQYIDYEIS